MRKENNILKTEIPGLDTALNGGIPTGSTVLIQGPTGMGKTILALQLSYNILKKNGTVGYLSTEQHVEDLLEQARVFNWNLNQYKKSTFVVSDNLPRVQATIDIFTAPEGEWDYFDVGPDDTKDLDSWAIWFNSELEKRNLSGYDLIVIDSINGFLNEKNDERKTRPRREILTKFLSAISEKSNTTTLLIANEPLPEIERLVDGVLETKTKNLNLYMVQKIMRIKDFRKVNHKVDWIPYSIDPQLGMIFQSPFPLTRLYLLGHDHENLISEMGHERIIKDLTDKMFYPYSLCLKPSKHSKILIEVNGLHEVRPYLYYLSQQAFTNNFSIKIYHKNNLDTLIPDPTKKQSPFSLKRQPISKLANQQVKVIKVESENDLLQMISKDTASIIVVADLENFFLQQPREKEQLAIDAFARQLNVMKSSKMQIYFLNHQIFGDVDIARLEHAMDDVIRLVQENSHPLMKVVKSAFPSRNKQIYLSPY